MANVDRPSGLRPVRYRNGTPWTGKSRPYYVSTTPTTGIFIGDPVDIAGDSNTAEIVAIGGKFAPGTLSRVTLATAGDGNRISGVVTGFMPTTRDSTTYREGSTARVALVCDDPNVVFEVQDDASGALATTTVGLNANLVAGAGSAISGLSGWELDATTPAADASFQLLIERMANIEEDNVAADGNAKWEVMINLHRFRDTANVASGDGASLGV